MTTIADIWARRARDPLLHDLVVVGTAYVAVERVAATRMPRNRIGSLFLVAAPLWLLDLLLAQIAWYGAMTAPRVGAWRLRSSVSASSKFVVS